MYRTDMIEEAVILIPEGEGRVQPSYLFAPVAGLPLLKRKILGLIRAGIHSIKIMAPPALQPDLERRLAQLFDVDPGARPRFHPRVKINILSNWRDLWKQGSTGKPEGGRLTVMANVLADPRFLVRFIKCPAPEGQLAVAVVQLPPPAGGERSKESRPPSAHPVILEDGLVTPLDDFRNHSGHASQAAGAALFSPGAWRDWQVWQMAQKESPDSFPSDPEAVLFQYIAQQARAGRVWGVVGDPLHISVIHSDQDRKEATARLIVSSDRSPLGDGALENSLNRLLARRLLPWLLASRLTPNQITMGSLLLGLGAALGFSYGDYLTSVAAGLLPLVVLLDYSDGAVARLKFQESRLGARLDLYGDTILNLLIFWGIALGQYRASGQGRFLWLGLLLTVGYLVCWRLLAPPEAWRWEPAKSPPGTRLHPSKLKKLGKFLEETVSRDFFYIITLCALFDVLDRLFIGIAVGTNIFALFLWRRRGHGKA